MRESGAFGTEPKIEWKQPGPATDELAAAYNAMREPVEPGNLPSAIYVLQSRLAHAEAERMVALDEVASAIATDGDFDRWMREAHVDARNGTSNAEGLIRAFLERRFGGGKQ